MSVTYKVLISMPSELLEMLDNHAALEYRSRSEMIREMIRHYNQKTNGDTGNG